MLWTCPKCGDAKRAPKRPRRNDVRRFCLSCSAKGPVLVERVCAALERRRNERAAAAKARRSQHTQKQREAQLRYPASLHLLFDRWQRLKTWQDDPRGPERLYRTALTVRYGNKALSSGRAWSSRIVVTAGWDEADGCLTLLHEMAHVVAGEGHGHDTRFYALYYDAIEEVFGVKPGVAPTRYGRERKMVAAVAALLDAHRGLAMFLRGAA